MCRPARWLLGLIPLFLLFIAALALKAPEIRRQLAANTLSRLSPQGVVDGDVAVSGRDVALSGLTFSDAARAQAVAAADAVRGVRLVRDDLSLPPVSAVYAFSASRDSTKIVLSGLTPDLATRQQTIAAARALAGEVEDKLVYARGAPSGYRGMIGAALAPLSQLSSGSADIAVSGEKASLTVKGVARDAQAYRAALSSVAQMPQGLSLDRADIQAPPQSPFVWSAVNDGKIVQLSGFVPSEDARKQILDAAGRAMPKLRVVDKMVVAGGAAPTFAASAVAGIGALGGLNTGVAKLSDLRFSLSGVVKDGGSVEALSKQLANALPKPTSLASYEVVYPLQTPYFFNAVKNADGKIALDGFAPSEGDKAQAMGLAQVAADNGQSVIKLARGLSPSVDFGAASQLGFKILGWLQFGQMRIDDQGLSVRGGGLSASLAEIKALVASSSVKIGALDLKATDPAPPPPPPPLTTPAPVVTGPTPRRALNEVEAQCQSKMSQQLSQDKIQFATGSADIDPASDGLLKQLAKVLTECADVSIEISGHTDNTGDRDRNKILSQARAKSVVDALTADGIALNRLEAVGYGEERPIATNDTAEGRAQNRRIEFIVK